jgi:hypothetical protein
MLRHIVTLFADSPRDSAERSEQTMGLVTYDLPDTKYVQSLPLRRDGDIQAQKSRHITKRCTHKVRKAANADLIRPPHEDGCHAALQHDDHAAVGADPQSSLLSLDPWPLHKTSQRDLASGTAS